MNNVRIRQCGFTIVELLVVIVIIGILAAISIVSYVGITQRATTAGLQSDLASASKQLEIYYVDNMAYPTSNDCSTPNPAPPIICLKTSSGNIFTYQPNGLTSPQSFNLTAINGSNTYRVSKGMSPAIVKKVTQLSSGGHGYNCVIASDGLPYCWGV